MPASHAGSHFLIHPMAEQEILYSVSDGIARITLNRPGKLNSLNAPMKAQLRSCLDSASQAAGVRAMLITGAGRAFCAGQDLAERRRAPGEPVADLRQSVAEFWNPLVRTIAALPFPVICAVNGIAAGAGMNLALACDIVLAARSASFVESFAKIGLIPDCGGTYFLPRLAGPARAMAAALLAAPITAAHADLDQPPAERVHARTELGPGQDPVIDEQERTISVDGAATVEQSVKRVVVLRIPLEHLPRRQHLR
jgi:2-(1,2-epoxy-1,2-dihydrophenyl)acetyl-CoA isomerase